MIKKLFLHIALTFRKRVVILKNVCYNPLNKAKHSIKKYKIAERRI